jgi:hypothetical protein
MQVSATSGTAIDVHEGATASSTLRTSNRRVASLMPTMSSTHCSGGNFGDQCERGHVRRRESRAILLAVSTRCEALSLFPLIAVLAA